MGRIEIFPQIRPGQDKWPWTRTIWLVLCVAGIFWSSVITAVWQAL